MGDQRDITVYEIHGSGNVLVLAAGNTEDGERFIAEATQYAKPGARVEAYDGIENVPGELRELLATGGWKVIGGKMISTEVLRFNHGDGDMLNAALWREVSGDESVS